MVKPARTPDTFRLLPTYLAFELVRLARRRSAELFPEEELRLPHAMALAALTAHGPMSQRELSESLRLDPGDLVAVIDALEEMGYVVRQRDPRDRRRYALQVTETGRRALRERRDRAVRLHEAIFAPLTEREREQLQDLLLRVLAHHDSRFAAASDGDGDCDGDGDGADARPAAERPAGHH